jgi:hypothetical protein
LTHADATSDPSRVVGGRSGGILNEVLLQEFREVAKVSLEPVLRILDVII